MPSHAALSAAFRAERESAKHSGSAVPPGVEPAVLEVTVNCLLRLDRHVGRPDEIGWYPGPSGTLERAIPVLASLDLEQTQQFYGDRLGFTPLFAYADYAISARDDVQIHFWLTDDRRYAENTSGRIDLVGVDALYAEMSAAGVVHPNGHRKDQPWGMREFSVLDGDGNLIKFGQRAPVDPTGA